MKNKILSVLLVIFALLVVAALALFIFGGNTEKNEGEISVSVSVTNGGKTEEHTIKTTCDNLGDALLQSGLIKGDDGEYGLYITEVTGIAADAEKEQWWCITKGGETVQTGVSQIKISDGEKYELTLKEGY